MKRGIWRAPLVSTVIGLVIIGLQMLLYNELVTFLLEYAPQHWNAVMAAFYALVAVLLIFLAGRVGFRGLEKPEITRSALLVTFYFIAYNNLISEIAYYMNDWVNIALKAPIVVYQIIYNLFVNFIGQFPTLRLLCAFIPLSFAWIAGMGKTEPKVEKLLGERVAEMKAGTRQSKDTGYYDSSKSQYQDPWDIPVKDRFK